MSSGRARSEYLMRTDDSRLSKVSQIRSAVRGYVLELSMINDRGRDNEIERINMNIVWNLTFNPDLVSRSVNMFRVT